MSARPTALAMERVPGPVWRSLKLMQYTEGQHTSPRVQYTLNLLLVGELLAVDAAE